MKEQREEQRGGFTFYRSYFDSVEALGYDYYYLYSLIARYSLEGIEPTDEELSDVLAKTIWKAMFPFLEGNRKKWLNGKNGGCPPGQRNNPNGRRTNRELTEN